MALTGEHLQVAMEVVGGAPTVREAAAQWRARFPEVRAVVVDAMDMRDESPALRLGSRSVYLAASQGHCWHVTEQAEEASALILTEE